MRPIVHLGDWRDVLPGAYDPASAIVITDPPFGLEGDRGFADSIPWADHVRELLEMLPAVRHVIRGPSMALIGRDHPPPRRVCVEVSQYRRRDAFRPGAVPYMWQGWAVYGRLKVANRRPRGDAAVADPYMDRALRPPPTTAPPHRGITPYSSARWIVEDWADPGMLVVDPFAGTGTIGRAAIDTGRAYLGAEILPHWHTQAVANLGVAQPALGL